MDVLEIDPRLSWFRRVQERDSEYVGRGMLKLEQPDNRRENQGEDLCYVSWHIFANFVFFFLCCPLLHVSLKFLPK